METIRKLNTFIAGNFKLTFGDYVLFQEYKQAKPNGYSVSKPIFAIYLGSFIADQTLGFNYVRWINENRTIYITNEHVTNYMAYKEVDKIESHIEWDDYIDVLGYWEQRPTWQEILKAYRKQVTKQRVFSKYTDID